MTRTKLRIIHETNPRKYYPAIFELEEQGALEIVGEHRYSVIKEWFRSAIRDRKGFAARTRDALKDLAFRAKVPFVSGEVILLGFAPWDYRILWYRYLARRNTILYHTSWPYWSVGETPRQYPIIQPYLKSVWLKFLRHSNVRVVCVLQKTQDELEQRFGVSSVCIPHAVPQAFYDAAQGRGTRDLSAPLNLIYVGELSVKKGIPGLLDFVANVPEGQVHLTIVGDGALRGNVTEQATSGSVTFLGKISDRAKLAEIMAEQDVLVLLSQKHGGWEELFGIVIIEALAAGLGVVTTDHIGPKSIFVDMDTDFLIPEGNLSLAKARIEKLASDPAYRSAYIDQTKLLPATYSTARVREAWKMLIHSAVKD